jgi:ubiquinol-cytochrome c reductase cytochrome b subunit
MICKEKKAQNICMVRQLPILKQLIFSTLNNHLIDYPTLGNLSYWWSFGLLAGICLVIQIITCVFKLCMIHLMWIWFF